jgi:hypothetical protein
MALLKKHLIGTFDILNSWHAKPFISDAGLYHAAYGTEGFDEQMVSVEQRRAIGEIIGTKAEELVYLYCACDRTFFNENCLTTYLYKDRFTNKNFKLDKQTISDFCELTVANELEIANNSKEFIEQYGAELKILFNQMAPYTSKCAKSAIHDILY